MEDCSEEQLCEELKNKRICRFCLNQEEPLSDIFSSSQNGPSDSKISKTTTPLTLQIMACVSIEVYKDDGMPSTICDNCRLLMDHSYRFKQICKKADTLLKTYPLTGVWPEKLQVPINLFKSNALTATTIKRPQQHLSIQEKQSQSSVPGVTKALPPVAKPVQSTSSSVETTPVPKKDHQPTNTDTNTTRLPVEPTEEDVKPKIVKLSIEELKNINQGKPINKANLIQKTSPSNPARKVYTRSTQPEKSSAEKRSPVKIINGSLGAASKAPIILNSMKPPNKTEEHIVQTSDGTLEIVCIESTQEPTPEVTDPIKNAPPVETNVFPCTECERTFPLRQLLEIHMQNHVRERNFPCEMCDRRFFSKYDLSKHILTHTGERPYVCIICKAAFSRSTLLTRHQKVHKDQPKFLCMCCERTFLSNEELQKHMEFHQKKRPFQCQKCPKSFAYKQGLERHEVVHKTNLPFPCEHCNLSFSSASKLARHLTAHAGSRPYPCRLCSRSFMLSHHLTRHVRSHLGGKGAYKCNECSSMFDNLDDLIYHSAEHATKSLTCPLCREHSETLEQVTEHIKEHSEGVQYACDYCDLLYTTEQKLESHCYQEHLSVLAMDRSEVTNNTPNESEDNQKFIIEEISIHKDGSQMITTFIDGKEKDKKFIHKDQAQEFKSEIVLENNSLGNEPEQNQSETYEDAEEDDEYYGEEFDEDTEEITIKNEKPEPIKKSPSSNKVETPLNKPNTTKSPTVAESGKTRQQKLDAFLKKTTPAATPSVPKSFDDVLKKLPKGVIVKKPASVTSSTVEKKPAPVLNDATSTNETTVKTVTVQKKVIPDKLSPKTDPQNLKNVPTKQPIISPPAKFATKRPAGETGSPSPVKKMAVESSKNTPTATPVVSASKAVQKSGTPSSSAKKSKTFEMKIGDKMVKVQKVVMTKAEVAAMARDGKIEMQGDTMILKQGKIKK